MRSLPFFISLCLISLLACNDQTESAEVQLDLPALIHAKDANHFDQLIKASTAFAELEIYNRWGEKVHESRQPGQWFEGMQLKEKDTYVYILKYATSPHSQELESQKGNIRL